MTPANMETVNKLGLSFDAAFAKWIEDNRADIDALEMTPGAMLAMAAAMKLALMTFLNQQAGSAVPEAQLVVVPALGLLPLPPEPLH